MAHSAGKDVSGYGYPTHDIGASRLLTTCATGKEISFHARTHTTRTSELLHTKIAGNRREFPVDDQHTSLSPSSTTAYSRTLSQRSLYVRGKSRQAETILRLNSRCQRSGSILPRHQRHGTATHT